MELSSFFKSVVEQDTAPVVICDRQHTIVYMNPAAAARYANRGGSALVGQSLLRCHNAASNAMIEKAVAWFGADKRHNIVYTYRNVKENKDVYMVALRDEDGALIGYYEKHEYRTPETMALYDFGD